MSFDGTDRRRSPRLRVRIPAVLCVESVEDACETVEVGLGGVFVATFETYLLRQLVELRLGLEEDEEIRIRGMIVRVVNEEDAFRLDTEPGVGVQFYGVPEEEGSAWSDFFERNLQEAGFFEDADARTLRDEREALAGAQPIESSPEPIECLEDASEMLERGFSLDQVARAAGIDPTILAAAFASDELTATAEDGALIGQTVEGVSLLSSKPPPMVSQDEIVTVPAMKSPTVAEAEPTAQAPPESIASVIRIIGSSPPGTAPREPATAARGQEEPSVDDETALDALDGDEGPDTTPKIRLVALGPIQPPPRHTSAQEKRKPRLVPVASAPLAPTGVLPHVVYRLEMPTVAALEEFQHGALEAGGVFILTVELRATGTPVVVCVVHPNNKDEFHIPGTVTHALGSERGVNVKFDGLTERTLRSFTTFITVGKASASVAEDQPYPSQEITMVSRASEVMLRGKSGASIPKDTQPVKMSEIEPLKKG